jgi:hypothetical protein
MRAAASSANGTPANRSRSERNLAKARTEPAFALTWAVPETGSPRTVFSPDRRDPWTVVAPRLATTA